MIRDSAIFAGAATPIKYERTSPSVKGLIVTPTFSANADPTKFDLTAFAFVMDGELRYFAAKTAQVFSAVHATGIAAWLGIGIYSDRDGNILTKANPNTGDQDYATEALALASIPSAPAGYVQIGTFTLLTAAADWDANTDSLSSADLVSANYLGLPVDRRLLITKLGYNYQVAGFAAWCRSASGIANLEMYVGKQGATAVLTNPNVAVDRHTVANATVTKLKVGNFDYVIDGVLYHKDATDALAFTAAHLVALDKWGAILLLINAAGTYSTLVGEVTQTTAMAYNNSALARAALPAVPEGKVAIGVLVIEADGSTWTANTDDIVAGSDLEGFDIIPALQDRNLADITLAIDDGEEEDFTVTAFTYTLEGVRYSKAAAAGIDFSAAHVCTAEKFLPILIQINAAGTVSTRVPLVSGRSQTAAQGYDTYAAAVAALPNTELGKIAIGYIVIEADAGVWTANTDDMVAGSDCENSWFVGLSTIRKNGFEGIEGTAQNDSWPVTGAQFAADAVTPATLPNSTAPKRGWNDAYTALYLASATGLVSDVRADWVHRPFPLNEEVAQ